jgi:hypothetical protein
MRGFWSLLDAAQPPCEADAPDPFQDGAQLGRRGAGRQRRLPRCHLAEVDEAGEAADRAADEGRSRARAADHEHEPLFASQPRPLHERALCDARTGGAVVE